MPTDHSRQGGFGRGMRIATTSDIGHWSRNDMVFTRGAVQVRAGRCGERTERCRWQKRRSERVAAVKILSVRRKAAQKFWAPQQDHRPLRRECKIERRGEGTPPYGGVTRSACMRADRGVRAYGGLQGVQWAGDRKGRPYERVTRGAVRCGIPQSRLRRARADCQASATLFDRKSSVGESQPRHFLGRELIRSTT